MMNMEYGLAGGTGDHIGVEHFIILKLLLLLFTNSSWKGCTEEYVGVVHFKYYCATKTTSFTWKGVVGILVYGEYSTFPTNIRNMDKFPITFYSIWKYHNYNKENVNTKVFWPIKWVHISGVNMEQHRIRLIEIPPHVDRITHPVVFTLWLLILWHPVNLSLDPLIIDQPLITDNIYQHKIDLIAFLWCWYNQRNLVSVIF